MLAGLHSAFSFVHLNREILPVLSSYDQPDE
jgi:hypothetical protein